MAKSGIAFSVTCPWRKSATSLRKNLLTFPSPLPQKINQPTGTEWFLMLLHEEKVSQSRLPSDTQIPWKSNQSEIWHMCVYIYLYSGYYSHLTTAIWLGKQRVPNAFSPLAPHYRAIIGQQSLKQKELRAHTQLAHVQARLERESWAACNSHGYEKACGAAD